MLVLGSAAVLLVAAAAITAACAVYAGREGAVSEESVEWSVLVGDDANAKEPGSASLLLRALVLMAILLPLAAVSPLALLGTWARRAVFYPLTVRALSAGGPALQKWGQWSATRPDMFPEGLCDALRKLHTRAPAHGWRHTLQVCEEALGRPLGDVFAEFQQQPLASGSIAQVHEAVMRETGERVAVKVRHPRVMELLWVDVQLMRGLAWAVDAFVPALQFLHLQSTVAQFMHTIAAQARLDVEAQYLKEMRRNFASRGWRDVRIPRPLFAAPAVIIETLEAGKPVGDIRRELSRAAARFVINRGQDIYLKMLLADRFMHGDLHPGNMLVETSADGGCVKALVLVDLGMVARLSEVEQANFLGLIRALGYGDGRAAAACVLRFCAPGSQACTGACAEAFVRDMEALFREACRGFGTATDFGQVLRGVLALVRRHEVTISANYATLVVNVLCLDGLASELAPEYNLLDGCAPLLRLSSLGRNRAGRLLMRALYPAVSAMKVSADGRFRRRHLRDATSSSGAT